MGRTSPLSLIGDAPLVELRGLSPKPGVRIFGKMEGQNPTGSIKDRIALALVERAESEGRLAPGDTILEASSGNTAIALAFVAKQKGYRAHVVVPEGVAPSISDLLDLLGAEVTWCGVEGGMGHALEVAADLAADRGYKLLGQFTDQANPDTHYASTGREIADALPSVDVFVAGIGTGGTIMGAGRRIKERWPHARVVGVEPKLGERLQGIKNLDEGFIPPLLDLAMIDGRFLVDSASSFRRVQDLARAEGLFAGASSGAVLDTALRLAERMEQGVIVAMLADSSWKYLPARPWRTAQSERADLDEVHWW